MLGSEPRAATVARTELVAGSRAERNPTLAAACRHRGPGVAFPSSPGRTRRRRGRPQASSSAEQTGAGRPPRPVRPLGSRISWSMVEAGSGGRGGVLSTAGMCRVVRGGLVSIGSGEEERGWAAERRDFVADRRDEVADERDRVAEARDRVVDAREAGLEEWERRLDARAGELGLSGGTEVSGSRAVARGGRLRARQDRERAGAERLMAAADREEAVKRRQADAPPTRLAMVFAGIAEQLYDAGSVDEVLVRIAEAAVSTVGGCRMASVTLADRSGYRTVAATDSAAMAVDSAQYQAQEGPCLDAVDAPMVYAQSFPDRRCPTS